MPDAACHETPGRYFDAFAHAEHHGVKVIYDERAPRMGDYCEETKTVRLRPGQTHEHDRALLTLNLGWAVLPRPNVEDVWHWVGERLVPEDDLEALRSATSSRRLWARALLLPTFFLTVYLTIANVADIA
jgi:hypothetical protein